MNFKIGDKVKYLPDGKEYTITGICTCSYCKRNYDGIGFTLDGTGLAKLKNLEPVIEIGKQLLFDFMLSEPT